MGAGLKGFIVSMLAMLSAVASAQTPSLEDLERKLEQLKSDEAEAARRSKAAREREDAIKNQGGFVDIGAGRLRDVRTGLVWTQRDSGADVNWTGAKAWCADMGVGWRLPTVAELQGIYDPTGRVRIRCGSVSCNVSPLFQLTSYWFWSSEAANADAAWNVLLNDGSKFPLKATLEKDERALCVMKP